MSLLEIAANAVVAMAIFLAGRNNIHTWWIGIIGCGLFAALFYQSQLYALIVGGAYAFMLQRFTDAYAPGWDSLMLVMSVIAQLLMMYRKLERRLNPIPPLFILTGLQSARVTQKGVLCFVLFYLL